MLVAVTDPDEIAECQEKYKFRVKSALRQQGHFLVGYPGGSGRFPVWHSPRLGLWCMTDCHAGRGSAKRHWNCCGLNLSPKQSNSIVVQINPMFSGFSKRVAGLYARDDATGTHFMLHSGRVGGGKKGIGKTEFLNWYKGNRVLVDDGGRTPSEWLLVGCLDSMRFVIQLLSFVRVVEKFRNRNDEPATPAMPLSDFMAEYSGVKHGHREGDYEAQCDHGIVVDALRRKMTSPVRAGKLVNNRYVDLARVASGKVLALYEVKTKTDTQSIYTGVGQLMCHGQSLCAKRRILVLPELQNNQATQWRSMLALVGIELIEYKWKDSEVIFVNTPQGRQRK